jgi:hypothetical protein
MFHSTLDAAHIFRGRKSNDSTLIFVVNISKALPLAVALATHSFQHCFDINNDEAMGNHSEVTVVTVAVVLLVISRYFCIVFSDDLLLFLR